VLNGINGVRSHSEKIGSQQRNVLLYVVTPCDVPNRLAIPMFFAGNFLSHPEKTGANT
jgi:hypothetical protein